MLLQISSGQGPVECELAVAKLAKELEKELNAEIIEKRDSRFSDGYISVLMECKEDVSFLEGTIQWVCKSPIRPNHRRKNWFVDISIIPEVESVNMDKNIRFERFHCGGNGGQNVNKVETGVRLIHIPTGIAVTSTAERSQLQNRKDAMRKLMAKLAEKNKNLQAKQTNEAWQQHTQLVRGNPVRVYKGEKFKRVK